jgi:hypothetical protein
VFAPLFSRPSSNKPLKVETTGFEPATPALQRRCSTSLSYVPERFYARGPPEKAAESGVAAGRYGVKPGGGGEQSVTRSSCSCALIPAYAGFEAWFWSS